MLWNTCRGRTFWTSGLTVELPGLVFFQVIFYYFSLYVYACDLCACVTHVHVTVCVHACWYAM